MKHTGKIFFSLIILLLLLLSSCQKAVDEPTFSTDFSEVPSVTIDESDSMPSPENNQDISSLPVPDPTPVLTPVPTPEPILEPTPVPTPEPTPEPTPFPTPGQVPEPPPVPSSEPVPEKNGKLYVLMYHHFVPDNTECNEWTLTVSRFREDLQWLSDHGYVTVFPSELAGGIELPEKAVMITFDDGYLSNYELAFPLLQEYNSKATISLITCRIGYSFTWEMCREMAQSGLVEFGSHTHQVHSVYSEGVSRLKNESLEEYQNRVFPDIETSIDLIETNIGTTVHLFAYPYGKTDEWAKEFIQNNFSVSVNSNSTTGDIRNGLYDLPRYNISMNTPLSKYLDP